MLPNALFIVVNLLCITVSAYFAVDGFYGAVFSRLDHKPASVAQDINRPDDKAAARLPLSAYSAVLERNLFNTRARSASAPEKSDVESLEETKLNLKLWGTVSGTDNGIYAVIEDVKAREQNLYRIGETVQTATVKEIYREKVVLTVNGKDEILQMQELKSGTGRSRSGRTVARAAASGTTPPRAQRISLRRSYIEQAMTDVASLMTQMQVKPHMEDGVPAGLALASIKPNSIFRRMGLRNGDIITGVDGDELSTVDDALKLVEDLKSASSLSLQLKRRGREKNIEYRIR